MHKHVARLFLTSIALGFTLYRAWRVTSEAKRTGDVQAYLSGLRSVFGTDDE